MRNKVKEDEKISPIRDPAKIREKVKRRAMKKVTKNRGTAANTSGFTK